MLLKKKKRLGFLLSQYWDPTACHPNLYCILSLSPFPHLKKLQWCLNNIRRIGKSKVTMKETDRPSFLGYWSQDLPASTAVKCHSHGS